MLFKYDQLYVKYVCKHTRVDKRRKFCIIDNLHLIPIFKTEKIIFLL